MIKFLAFQRSVVWCRLKTECNIDAKELGDKPWHKLIGGSLWAVLWVHHEQHVRESCSKVGSIRVVVPRGFRGVHIHALWAIKLHHRFSRYIR